MRAVLAGPLGRHVAGGLLQADPPAVTGVERDPIIVVGDASLVPYELLIERGQAVDVRGVQCHGPQ